MEKDKPTDESDREYIRFYGTGLTSTPLNEIHRERARQFAKWGFQDVTPAQFFAILGEELGEIGKEVNDNHFEGYKPEHKEALRNELIQLAAVAVQWLQWIDRAASGRKDNETKTEPQGPGFAKLWADHLLCQFLKFPA